MAEQTKPIQNTKDYSNLSLEEVRAIALKGNECIIMRQYRYLSTRITKYLIKTRILPYQVTFISLLLALAAGFFFLLGEHHFIVIGAVLFQLSYLMDCVDGEIARIKGTGSGFGRWLDSSSDFIGAIVVYSCAIIGQFLLYGDVMILLLGFVALNGLCITMFVVSMKARYFDREFNPPTIRIKKSRYVGSTSILTEVITIAAILNNIFIALIFYAVIGNLMWMIILVIVFRNKQVVNPKKQP